MTETPGDYGDRQEVKTICNNTGSNMGHVLRVLALKWMEEKEETDD